MIARTANQKSRLRRTGCHNETSAFNGIQRASIQQLWHRCCRVEGVFLAGLISDKVNVWREVAASASALSEDERCMMRSSAREGFLMHFAVEATAADLLQLMETVKRSN